MEYAISVEQLPHLRIVGKMNYSRGWQRSTRSRFNIVFFMYRGEFVFELDSGRTLTMSDNCALFIEAGTSYRVSCTRDCEYAYVHFTTDGMIAQKDECACADEDGFIVLPELIDLSADGEGRDSLVRRIERVERSFSSGESYASVRARCETALVLVALATAHKNRCRRVLPHSLALMCDYVRSNLEKPTKLSDLCRASGLSKQYAMELFRTHMGMNATDYIHRTKLRYSLGLLRETDMTVSEIAYSLGYCGSYYFCRVFKKYCNITPTEYRNFTPELEEL